MLVLVVLKYKYQCTWPQPWYVIKEFKLEGEINEQVCAHKIEQSESSLCECHLLSNMSIALDSVKFSMPVLIGTMVNVCTNTCYANHTLDSDVFDAEESNAGMIFLIPMNLNMAESTARIWVSWHLLASIKVHLRRTELLPLAIKNE